MSQYSETMGSFIRTSNYPLEANYIFRSKEELDNFYSDEINNTLLHKGLLKVVASANEQTLYWVVQKEGKLQFKELISGETLEDLYTKIVELKDSLNQEIELREQAITEILGTTNKQEFDQQLNNLLSVSNAIIKLQKSFSNFEEIMQAVIGSDPKDLELLDYKSITEISKFLNSFFGTFEFFPESDFKSLKGIRNFIQNLSSTCSQRDRNLQEELNQTQVGVGLDQSGQYSPDQETNYLKNATSVMNALRTLDSLIKQALSSTIELKDVQYNQEEQTINIEFILSDGTSKITTIPVEDLLDKLYEKAEMLEWYEG